MGDKGADSDDNIDWAAGVDADAWEAFAFTGQHRAEIEAAVRESRAMDFLPPRSIVRVPPRG